MVAPCLKDVPPHSRTGLVLPPAPAPLRASGERLLLLLLQLYSVGEAMVASPASCTSQLVRQGGSGLLHVYCVHVVGSHAALVPALTSSTAVDPRGARVRSLATRRQVMTSHRTHSAVSVCGCEVE